MTDLSNIVNKIAAAKASNVSKQKNATTASNNNDNKNVSTSAATKKFSITIKGETHSLILAEDGTRYDYNEKDQTWATKKGDETWIFTDTDKDSKQTKSSIDLSKIDVEKLNIISKNTTKSYTLNDKSTVNNFKTTDGSLVIKDNNAVIDYYNVAIIDDFKTRLMVDNTSDAFVEDMDIGLTHGDLVESIIKSGNDDDSDKTNDIKTIKYDLGSDMSYASILTALKSVETRIKAGEDIDALNLSIEVAVSLADVGLSDLNNLTAAKRTSALNKLKNEGYNDLVDVINKITDLSTLGLKIFISSGNDADDVYYDKNGTEKYGIKNNNETVYSQTSADYESYVDADTNKDGNITQNELYNYYKASGYETNNDNIINDLDLYNINKSYDKDGNGVITGKELGVFNALTLASGSSINVIGSLDSAYDTNKTDGIAEYSNQNALVDQKLSGDVKISYVEYNSATGKYGYDVDGDKKTDFWSNGPEFSADDNSITSYDDGTYGYDLDGNGTDDIYSTKLYESVEEIKGLYNDKYLTTGTSFSAPLATKLNNPKIK